MNRMTRLLPLLALLGAGACIVPPEGSVNRISGGEGRPGTTKEVGNRALDSALEMRNIIRAEQNGLMVVQLDLVNRKGGPLAFQWSVEWFDRAGLKLDYVTQNWTPERLAGGASKTIKIVAPSPEATGWQLQVGSRDEIQ